MIILMARVHHSTYLRPTACIYIHISIILRLETYAHQILSSSFIVLIISYLGKGRIIFLDFIFTLSIVDRNKHSQRILSNPKKEKSILSCHSLIDIKYQCTSNISYQKFQTKSINDNNYADDVCANKNQRLFIVKYADEYIEI
jgi:hypothetical protein